MARKCVTQFLPWLLPLRKKQRRLCTYAKMRLDGNRYADEQATQPLPYLLFETRCPLLNRNTGFDMVYQENKAFNVRLAAATLDKLLIRPRETFSFWWRVRHADRITPYKDALAEVNGKLTTQPGGGLCQISNLLNWMFLHTPLTPLERHGHAIKYFPEPPSDAPMGVDATVSEGWLDLRVRNDTGVCFQIALDFDDAHIIGRILTDVDTGVSYRVYNGEPSYYAQGDAIYEEVDVYRDTLDKAAGETRGTEHLYQNRCRVVYPLPDDTPVRNR